MRVLFLPQTSLSGASSRYRVYQYVPYLKKHAIYSVVHPGMPEAFFPRVYHCHNPLQKLPYLGLTVGQRMKDCFLVKNYNIVFLQKEILPQAYPLFERIISFLNPNLIFDFDDAIFLIPPQRRYSIYCLRYKNNISRILSLSRAVIVGNSYLKRYALKFNQNVYLIPTCVDTKRFTLSAARDDKKDKRVVIGWIGSPHTFFYLKFLYNALIELSRRYRICLHIVGGQSAFNLPGVEVVNKKWSLENEISDLQEFDIGIAPLDDTPWAYGKCGLKILQYMALEIPVVCSPVGVYLEMVKDRVNGFFAATDEEWVQKLSILISDKDLRRRMGLKGRKTVEERYSLRTNGPKLVEVLRRFAN